MREELYSYDLHMGPQHAGIHGNFAYKLKVDGEKIVEVKAVPGYLHRGFEKLMERRQWLNNVALVPRICVPEPDVNEAAYCMAVEQLANIEVPPRAVYIRTIILELARITSYLMMLGGAAAATGVYPVMYWGMGQRDLLLDLFEELTGARIYHIFMIPGGVRRDLPQGWIDKMLRVLDAIEKHIPDYYNMFFENEALVRRMKGLVKITPEQAVEMGITGPNLRATGVPYDLRKVDPYLAYPEVDFEVVTHTDGDALARNWVRFMEVGQSIQIIRQLADKLPKGAVLNKPYPAINWKVPAGSVFVHVESTKGEYGYYIVSDGQSIAPYRAYVRGPSTTHAVIAVEKLCVGLEYADFPVAESSLQICPPDLDK